MRAFRLWARVFGGKFLSDTLLLAFSFAWLVAVIIPLLLAKQHVYGAWYDYNVPILIIEAVVCVFAFAWAVVGIVRTIKKERSSC